MFEAVATACNRECRQHSESSLFDAARYVEKSMPAVIATLAVKHHITAMQFANRAKTLEFVRATNPQSTVCPTDDTTAFSTYLVASNRLALTVLSALYIARCSHVAQCSHRLGCPVPYNVIMKSNEMSSRLF